MCKENNSLSDSEEIKDKCLEQVTGGSGELKMEDLIGSPLVAAVEVRNKLAEATADY